MEELGLKKAKVLNALLEKPHFLIDTMLLGTNLTIVGATTIFSELISNFGISKHIEQEFYTTIILTPLVLIFGEIIPKTIFRFRANILMLKFSHYVNFFYNLFYPVVFILERISSLFILSNNKESNEVKHHIVSKKQLKTILKMGVQEGVIDKLEHRILYGIMEFSNKEAKEIMTPRVDVKAVSITASIEEIAEISYKTGFSRFPVYEGDIDIIKGILYVIDLVHDYDYSGKKTVRDFIRKPYFVPETKKIPDILAEMKRRKLHMAIVIDEYGGMAGIITMDDILEEIFGEIDDDYSSKNEEPEIKAIGSNKFSVSARLSIEDANHNLKLSIPDSDEYETIGGYIYKQLGYIPKKGDKLYIKNIGNISVEKADKRHIERVIIYRGNKI